MSGLERKVERIAEALDQHVGTVTTEPDKVVIAMQYPGGMVKTSDGSEFRSSEELQAALGSGRNVIFVRLVRPGEECVHED